MSLALLRAGEEIGLGEFLAGRGASSHLVASTAFRAALPVDPAGAFTHSTTLDEIPAGARMLYLDGEADERAVLDHAQQRYPELQLRGLRHHVLPMLATDRSPLKTVPATFRIGAIPSYAIACPARSGSTLLSRMLRMAGAGAPKEHLRSPLAAALASPGVAHAEIWRQVAGRAALDGVFGTKVVGQFLLEAAGAQSATERLTELAALGVRIVHLRRPVLETTVSRYLSSQTRQWHAHGVLTRDERERFEAVAYDFELLHQTLVENLRENAALDAAVAAVAARQDGRVLTLDYAELAADPLAALARVAAHIGVRVSPQAVKFEKLPVKISGQVSRSAEMAERFAADLASRGLTPP